MLPDEAEARAKLLQVFDHEFAQMSELHDFSVGREVDGIPELFILSYETAGGDSVSMFVRHSVTLRRPVARTNPSACFRWSSQ
jgi:hypothetical protein